MIVVTAVGRPTSSPCPSADVTITGLSGVLGRTVKIWRTTEGKRVDARGGVLQVLGTTIVYSDWECPFGTDVVYQATEYTSAGAVVGTDQSPAMQLDPGVLWISDPLNPSASCPVVSMDVSALSSINYDRAGAAVSLIGSDTPVAAVGIRNIASAVPLSMLAYTVGQRISILTVLRSADPVLVRTPGTTRFEYLPRLAYCSASSIVVQPWGAEASGCTIVLAVDLVAAPSASIVVPPRTYADLLAEASSYGDLLTLYPTYLSLLRGS